MVSPQTVEKDGLAWLMIPATVSRLNKNRQTLLLFYLTAVEVNNPTTKHQLINA
jgi:hypothetical protein